MNDKAPSLDQLHDIVVPDPVSWWPLAPGWYVLVLAVALLVAIMVVRLWYRWKTNAYRRIAIAELEHAKSVRDVSELLRRTALANVSRRDLASLTGKTWPDWLQLHCTTDMPATVHSALAEYIYRPQDSDADLSTLKTYAADWIRGHRVNPPSQPVQGSEVA